MRGVVVAMLCACSQAPLGDGARGLDPAFGDGGTVIVPVGLWDSFTFDARMDGDAIEVMIAGQNDAPDATGEIRVLHLDDTGATASERAFHEQTITGATFDASGNLLVELGAALTRLLPDLTVDASFHEIGAMSPPILAPDESLYVVGANAIRRFDSTGDLDTSFGSGGTATISGMLDGLTVGSDGSLVVGIDGPMTQAPTPATFGIVGLHADGSLDPATDFTLGFPGAQIASSRGVWIAPDDTLIVAPYLWGNPGPPEQWLLQHYDRAGRLLGTFDYDPTTGLASTLVFQGDGTILAGGLHQNPGAKGPLFWLARYTADGHLDPAFGNAGQLDTPIADGGGAIAKLLPQPDGSVVAVGLRQIEGEATTTVDVSICLARYSAP